MTTRDHKSGRRLRGFTLMEIAVSVGLSVLVFAAVATMLLYGSKSTAMLANYADLNRYDQIAADQFTRDLRQANQVLSCISNQLQVQEVDPATGVTNTLVYAYWPSNQTLTRAFAGVTNTLLKGITTNSLVFAMYQRNPIGGSASNFPTTNPAVCKIVQVAWTTSRTLMSLGETESVQSAKVVIRKE